MNLNLLADFNNSYELAVIYTKLPFNSIEKYKAHFEDCKNCLNDNNFKLFKIYNDNSITENSPLFCRAEFSKLIDDAKSNKFTRVIVPSIDILIRNYTEYLNLKSLLEELNIKLIVANLPF